MESVFFNDLVMERIASYLTFADIKACRLLCSHIKEIVTPVLMKRGVILTMRCGQSNGGRVDRSIGKGLELMALDPRLVRGLNLEFYESECDTDTQLQRPAIHGFLDNRSQVIQQFTFRAMSFYVSHFLEMMNTHDFPELRKIEIAEYEVHTGQLLNELELTGAFPKLTSIKFECFPYGRPGPSHFFGVVQNFINLTGNNLGELSITYSRFPDLSKCSSIKILEIIVPISTTESFPIQCVGVNKFVHEVKDTLEELRLDVRDSYQRDLTGLELPEMKRLKVFRNRTTLQYRMGRQINPENFPGLQIVELKDFLGLWMNIVMPQVTELSLLEFNASLPLDDKMKHIFPNVKKCRISSAERSHIKELGLHWLLRFFVSTNGWSELDMLEIRLAARTRVGDVLTAIGHLPVEGMKRIKIVLMKVDDDVSETEIAPLLTVRGRENLIKMRNLEMLEILGKIPSVMLEQVREFAEEQSLPVFIGEKRGHE